MKTNLLKKVFIITSLAAAVSACGGSDSKKTNENVAPVTISGDINIVVNEDAGLQVVDLLEGVTNSAGTPIFTRKFTFFNIDENEVPLYEGPSLPLASIYKRSDEMAIVTPRFEEALIHPATVEKNNLMQDAAIAAGELAEEDRVMYHSQGVYKFEYLLDNGSDTIITRNITVTVNAVEDLVTEIALSQPNGFKAPVGYAVPLKATITPSNATFPTITWASSDDSLATVDQDGNVTGVAEGNVTITATSADGAVVASTVAEVILVPTEPVAVDVVLKGTVVSGDISEISLASTNALSYNLIPVELSFTNDVQWTSSNPEAVSVDGDGNLTTHIVGETATITATVEDLTYLNQSFDVIVTPHANLFFGGDAGFESGTLDPNWSGTGDNLGIIEVREEAAMEGTYGLYIEHNGNQVKFISQPIAMRSFELDTTKLYKLSFYGKNLSGSWAGGPTWLYSNTGEWKGSYPKAGVGGNGGTWWGGTSAEWTEYKIYYNGADLVNLTTGDFRLHLQLNSGNSKFYLDNFRFEEVDSF